MRYLLYVIFLFPVYCYDSNNNEQYMLYPMSNMLNRYLRSKPSEPDEREMMLNDDNPTFYIVRKRNNAELVNHILKNLNGLDHLGDIGR